MNKVRNALQVDDSHNASEREHCTLKTIKLYATRMSTTEVILRDDA